MRANIIPRDSFERGWQKRSSAPARDHCHRIAFSKTYSPMLRPFTGSWPCGSAPMRSREIGDMADQQSKRRQPSASRSLFANRPVRTSL